MAAFWALRGGSAAKFRLAGNCPVCYSENVLLALAPSIFNSKGSITLELRRNPTRSVRIGSVSIGSAHPIAVQSMTATHTQNIEATVAQINDLVAAGADVVRVAVDNTKDAEALAEIRKQTTANLSVDLQENYRLAQQVAPHVDKIRYNPGHLYHHEREKPWQDKVKFLVDVAAANDCAIRVGVNCGFGRSRQTGETRSRRFRWAPMLESAFETLRAAGSAVVHAVLRFAERFGPAESQRSEPAASPTSVLTCHCIWE